MTFRPLIIITLLYMALGIMGATASYAATCDQPAQSPSIHIEVEADQPNIDHQRSRIELKQFNIATVSPYGTEQNVHVNGLMRGAITIETQMAIAWQRSATGGDNCFWYDHIRVNLKLRPVIYIAREIVKDTCLYKEVLRHEYKHYDVDYTTAKDYQIILQNELESFIRQTGVIGPYSQTMGEQAKNELARRLEMKIQSINDRLKFERVKRQSIIDTRQEYERVARACKNEASML